MDTTSLNNTSILDARSELECCMTYDPLNAMQLATACLVELKGRNEQKGRRQMLAVIIRKALKQVPME